MDSLARLCIHTITNRPWSLEEAIRAYAQAGVGGITIWRQALQGWRLQDAKRLATDAGLAIVSLCRGGFFPALSAAGRQAAIDDNLQAIDQAAELGAPLLVLVPGADPGQPLDVSRRQIDAGIAAILPHAEACGVRLGLEPLHPMYASSRSAINTMRQANELCDLFASPALGVVVDVYHLWWDPGLESEVQRAGETGRLFAFHVSDWKVDTQDLLYDRGLMGEGCIPLRQIRSWVEAAGFGGFHEVEIFSRHYWSVDQEAFLAQIVQAYRDYC